MSRGASGAPDLLDRIRGEIRERLEASRQAVQAYGRLERALAALKDDDRGVRRPAPRAAASQRRGAPAMATRRQANRARLIAALEERPGQTREELCVATELSGASVAQNLRRLIEQGRIEQRSLPGGGTVFALPATAPETVERQESAGRESSPQMHDSQVSTPAPEATPREGQDDGRAPTEAAGESARPETTTDPPPSAPRSRRARATSTRSRAKRAAKPTQPPATTNGQSEAAVHDEQVASDTRETAAPDATDAAS
jgi:hypothetical protein